MNLHVQLPERILACHNKHFFPDMNLQQNMQIIPEKKRNIVYFNMHIQDEKVNKMIWLDKNKTYVE